MAECIIPRRGIPVWESRGRLPAGHTELKYIQGTGVYNNNHITLPVKWNELRKLVFHVKVIAFPSQSPIMFVGGNQTTPYYAGNVVSGITISVNNFVNGGESTVEFTSSSSNNFNLGAWSDNYWSGTYQYGEIVGYDVNGDEKLHIVPDLNPSNVAGVYDLVSQAFYGSGGSSQYVAGEPV